MAMTSDRSRDPTLGHIRALDGMRGVAVLLVVCFHFGYIGAGWAGVQMFFVLSGFLITSILLAERDRPFPFYLKRFYWRRALRIFPLYYAFLAIVGVVALWSGPSAALRQQWLYLLTYTFNHARLLANYISPQYWGHLWSLSVEEQFYLLWPALIYFLPRRSLGWVLAGLVIGTPLLRLGIEIGFPGRALGHSAGYSMYFLTICQLDAFASGALVAYTRDSSRLRKPVLLWLIVSAAAIGIGLVNQSRLGDSPFLTIGYPFAFPLPYQSSWGYTILNLWSATLLMALLQNNALTRFFRTRPLAAVGKISYGVYVFHFPILALATKYTGLPLRSKSVPGLLVFALYLAATLAVSQFSYSVFERQFLALKNRRFVRPPQEQATPETAVA
jgi:peptidoglycan/LPS O-acetylase OafA/YrhL